MTKQEFHAIEAYMLSYATDSAHDKDHVYRVLYMAQEIASTETDVDMDILVAACLLHDIGRQAQAENPDICHARTGGEMAFDFLIEQGWTVHRAQRVRNCIVSHRYRRDTPPQTLEAKILFDADKLDAVGALGIARCLFYQGQHNQPLYILDEEGHLVDGTDDDTPSFFREYNFKLKKLYDGFHTTRGRELAMERKKTAEDFYNGIMGEVEMPYKEGRTRLESFLTD